MDLSTTRSVALFSIRPEFVERILDGTKRVEFRKTEISPDLEYVIVYCTSPVKGVVAFFKVTAIVKEKPRQIWAKYRNVAGVSYAFFRKYYEQKKCAIAIEVGQVFRLPRPILLRELDANLSPPQSFQYLPWSFFVELSRITKVL
jgi:predicted transcriptional regulator